LLSVVYGCLSIAESIINLKKYSTFNKQCSMLNQNPFLKIVN